MSETSPSKSARKRQYLALQELGETLIGLSEQALGELPLDDALREAIRAAKRIKARGALRRQRQLIGKLMRDADGPAIRQSLEALDREDNRAKAVFRTAEQWRDRIDREGRAAARDFAGEYPRRGGEILELQQALGLATSEDGRRRIRRRIFREIHAELVARSTTGPDGD